MNSRAQPPRTAGVCLVGYRLLLGLLPGVAIAAPTHISDIGSSISSRPYLAVLGSSPLRIQEVSPPPDLSVRPPAGAPPQLAPVAARSPVEIPPSPEASISTEGPPQTASATEMTPPPTEGTATPAPSPEIKPAKPARTILPDDTRPKVRAEDFLPFFQPPGSNQNQGDIPASPTPPAPGIQPPSSATYRQQ